MTGQLQAHSALISPDLKTTSLIVAEKFNKRHKDVLRAVYSLDVSRDFSERNFAFREEIQRHSGGSSTHRSSSLTPIAELSIVKGHVAKGRAGFHSPDLLKALAAPCSCGRGFSYGWAQREGATPAGFLGYRSVNPLSPNHPFHRGWSGLSLSQGVRP